ncbi:MAG: enamine deaminase RidA [Methylobacterium sp.]|nr:MAG: enamine deaminase RidA [Methylobacterium sp.]
MQMIEHNPPAIYPTGPDYRHALEVREPRRFLFVSGTMGLDPAGAPGKDLEQQLGLIWDNLRMILASAGMGVDNIVRLTSYLRDRAYVTANQDARIAALKGRAIPTTAIVVDTLERDWLVEIEIIAAA